MQTNYKCRKKKKEFTLIFPYQKDTWKKKDTFLCGPVNQVLLHYLNTPLQRLFKWWYNMSCCQLTRPPIALPKEILDYCYFSQILFLPLLLSTLHLQRAPHAWL